MRDFEYALGQLNPTRYYKMDTASSVGMTDYANGNTMGCHSYYSTNAPDRQNGYMLDQTRITKSYCFQAAHGYSSYNSYSLNAGAGSDNPANNSWSLVFAGLKPHDMAVARNWHDLSVGGADGGMGLAINPDGSITCSAGPSATVSSAAGVIVDYLPHLIVMSYSASSGQLLVYVGDWSGRFTVAIPATTLANITTMSANTSAYLGSGYLAGARADGFIDDFAVLVGTALTYQQAHNLFYDIGYGNGVTYPVTLGHRNMPLNAKFPQSIALDPTSSNAASDLAYKASASFVAGAGGFNYYQYTTSIYEVTAAFRNAAANIAPATWGGSPLHYGDPNQVMQYEDTPLALSARPSLGFKPSSGSDGHFCVYCPQTDEYWEGSGSISNTGTDAAPVWSFQYGGKITQFSLLMGSYNSTSLGCTACGVPVIFGNPRITDVQNAISEGIPLQQGLTIVMPEGLNETVWPGKRHDGAEDPGKGYYMAEAQTYRLPATAAVNAAIAAMPYPTGRVMAQAAQTYGMQIMDKNAYAVLAQIEDRYQFLTVNGYDPYKQDASGNTSNGLLYGQSSPADTMSGFPWNDAEVMLASAMNAADASQAVASAPIGMTGVQAANGSVITFDWQDAVNVSYWNVYQKVGSTYTLLGTTYWPQYSVYRPTGAMTFAVTAVNGSPVQESARSIDFTPPFPVHSRRRRTRTSLS